VYFSELFQIDQPEQYDWFDPILELDTLLFVDPFLISRMAVMGGPSLTTE
jgi:hypothetical protein